ncbi:MAG: hypothetical protein K6348_00315 [Deferribacterales bacterium]
MVNDIEFLDFFSTQKEFKTLDFSLNRIDSALRKIGFNEKDLGTVIHIAGTNGKGSTSYFIAQMFQKHGLKTALYTSPHIHNITERIKLNLKDVEYKLFNTKFVDFKEIILSHKLTFFEALTLIALKIFSEFKPDITILETGMGGRLDATNVINTKIPVITSISHDHTEFLGKNIFDILNEKLAIIKENKTLFLGVNKRFIIEYIKKIFHDREIRIIEPKTDSFLIQKYPKPYIYNYLLAKDVVEYVLDKNLPDDTELFLPPCRMEKIGRFILDGSHNPSGLLNTIKNFDSDTIIFSCTKDRPIEKMVKILNSYFKNIILTEIPNNERSISLENINIKHVLKIKDPITAINKSIDISNKYDIVIIGSLYLCAYIREYLKGKCV